MRFDILTIFPKIFDSYFQESILKRAQKKRLINIKVRNIRDFTLCNKHRKARPPRKLGFCGRCGRVDDRPYGGGAGMVMLFEPIAAAVQKAKSKIKNQKSKLKTRVILFSTRGKKFDQVAARRLAKYDQLILICGRYEGVDERVAQVIADEELSIGNYVLTGGEIPAMTVVDAVSRQIPGVLGKDESREEVQGSYPTYTRPEAIKFKLPNSKSQTRKEKLLKVPSVLLQGNHKEISAWRKQHQ